MLSAAELGQASCAESTFRQILQSSSVTRFHSAWTGDQRSPGGDK